MSSNMAATNRADTEVAFSLACCPRLSTLNKYPFLRHDSVPVAMVCADPYCRLGSLGSHYKGHSLGFIPEVNSPGRDREGAE